ncbi:MAG: alpha-L-rhamnosidase [Acidobacteriota bacterium]|nr:alpha-L-rhamnosidase [Acidobacteriota bacterium]
MPKLSSIAAILCFLGIIVLHGRAQALPGPLDPTWNLAAAPAPARPLLAEEYIWTAGEVTVRRPDHNKFPWNRPDLRVAPHYFRAHFRIAALPPAATLYIAGPREAHVFLNGHSLGDFCSNPDAPIGFHVFHASAAGALRLGDNVLAIEAVRGRGVVSATNSTATLQLAYGEVLVTKIVPARFGVDTMPLVASSGGWRSIAANPTKPLQHWSDFSFDDSVWQTVASLGSIESNVDFFQWSADAGMYGWPGYIGLSQALRTFPLAAVAVTHVFTGAASFSHLSALTGADPALPFTVTNQAAPSATDADAPSLLLDFGREISGRLLVESASPSDSTLSIAYGESEVEALATGLTPGQQGGNYLGTNILEVPANGVARGPKSGFRYVQIRFLHGAPVTAFKSIRAEGIYYPVAHAGTFESSDPLLNRIWETGAYTVHLCMQDGVLDAVKRDRGRWAGDLDVEGRVISTAFGDHALMEETLHALVPETGSHVNGIPSYSALWITSLADLYMHSGNRAFLAAQRDDLLRILAAMDASLNSQGLFENAKHQWLFVDWSPGLYAYTPEARNGTQLQYIRGYRAAASMLRSLGDIANAERYTAQADRLLAALHSLRDANGVTYGAGWQLNALAALTDDPQSLPVIWADVLSRVKQDTSTDPVISPYFNSYVLDAMAASGHRREALDWIRTYWGGMLNEGATSFWESYDLRWPKTNPHLSLQADGTSGYFVSMAHGWSSGPTAWLTENVLGVTPASPGYDTVNIHPDLLGLDYANGSVPTPHGTISIRVDKKKGIELDLPAGVTAKVEYAGHSSVLRTQGHFIIAAN